MTIIRRWAGALGPDLMWVSAGESGVQRLWRVNRKYGDVAPPGWAAFPAVAALFPELSAAASPDAAVMVRTDEAVFVMFGAEVKAGRAARPALTLCVAPEVSTERILLCVQAEPASDSHPKVEGGIDFSAARMARSNDVRGASGD